MKKILIIGESCRDIFVYCNANRLAPDLPIPVLSIVEQKENPGMAKNVERNIKAIYRDCHIVTNPNWKKVTKTRYMHVGSNHAFLRVDTDHNMKRVNVKNIPVHRYEIIAISDYNKGFLAEKDIEYICNKHKNVFVDTKKLIGPWLKNAKFIKINNYEYKRSLPIHRSIKEKIIRTNGDRGADFRGKNYPVKNRVEVKDVSGAGDSFFAALLVEYAKTGNIDMAINFANQCASEVVRHRGVTVIGEKTIS